MKYKFTYLKEEIDTEKDNQYHFGTIDFRGKKVSFLLSFKNDLIEVSELEEAEFFLDKLEKLVKKNQSILIEDFERKENGYFYEYFELFIERTEKKCKPKDLFDSLQLDRFIIYPNAKKNRAYMSFDYIVSSDYNDVLVLSIDREGNLHSLSIDT